MNIKYPIYVISKGRWNNPLTARVLEQINVPFKIVIEPQECEQYSKTIDSGKILTLPFGNLEKGSIPARNWAWEHSIDEGYKHHWILDDNIRGFYRLHNNKKYVLTDGVGFRVIEDFVDRYENIALSGMQYESFALAKCHYPPVFFNTRIYSCILIDNSIPYRWRGKYNEDTDLSLRALKDGWCTVLFYAFLADKVSTMTMAGGNTDELYKGDGRYKMALSLKLQHPDVTKISRKWGRWQHQVDYRPFRGNKLIKREGVEIPKGINNYGMRLVRKDRPTDKTPKPIR